MNTSKEVITVTRQTVLNGTVVAAVSQQLKRNIYTRKDGTQYVILEGQRREVIKGLVLI